MTSSHWKPTGVIQRVGSHLGLDEEMWTELGILEGVKQVVDELYTELRWERGDLDALKNALLNEYAVVERRIKSTKDLEELKRDYPSRGTDWATLLDGKWGVVRRIRKRSKKLLIVVDMRGKKQQRAEFTFWHELAHVVTGHLPEDGLDISVGYEPDDQGEKLMDAVASVMLYHSTVWTAATELSHVELLSFDFIECAREERLEPVSFYSTAIACMERFKRQAILVLVEPGLNKGEQARLDQFNAGQMGLFGTEQPPEYKLRIRIIRHGGDSFGFRDNFRVPHDSILSEVYGSASGTKKCAHENRNQWETRSDGYLDPLPLRVEVGQFGPNTLALIQPIERQS